MYVFVRFSCGQKNRRRRRTHWKKSFKQQIECSVLPNCRIQSDSWDEQYIEWDSKWFKMKLNRLFSFARAQISLLFRLTYVASHISICFIRHGVCCDAIGFMRWAFLHTAINGVKPSLNISSTFQWPYLVCPAHHSMFEEWTGKKMNRIRNKNDTLVPREKLVEYAWNHVASRKWNVMWAKLR